MDDGDAMVVGAGARAACWIVHVRSDNGCLSHHHAGQHIQMTTFQKYTVLIGEKVLLGLVHELLCYCIILCAFILIFYYYLCRILAYIQELHIYYYLYKENEGACLSEYLLIYRSIYSQYIYIMYMS